MSALAGRIALVTGGSRGTGARVAALLAEAGADVVITYRNKQARAEEVAAGIRALDRRALAVRADITSADQNAMLADQVRASFGRIDLLVLNASGGMEKDQPDGYALRINRDAQLDLVDRALPLMPPGSRIVFLTSHAAHFFPGRPVPAAYAAVAAGKRAGEDALRARIPELAARGIDLVVVSGDLIEDTIVARLLDRATPGLIEARRRQAGTLLTVDDFARGVVGAALDLSLASGSTVFVGSAE
jgi:NAD(P)-dependent dehydrogenase (short-subunit alcohol dehydrogenase family)